MTEYELMKDSGIEWLGRIPKEWSIFPAGGVFSEVKEKNTDNRYDNPFSFRYGEIVDKEIRGNIDKELKETFSNYTIVYPNTIMINGLNLNYDFISQRVAIVNNTGIITSAYLAVKPNEQRIFPRFVLYLLKAYDYKQVFHGIGSGIRKTLKFSDFKLVKIVAPEIEQQKTISLYLDTVCTNIDTVIAEAKASIEDYKLLKQSIITQAVTKGLNPNVPMKESGIEWIGEIPEYWNCKRLKYLISFLESGVSVNAGQNEAGNDELGVLKTSCVTNYYFDVHQNKSVNKDEESRVSCPVKGNTIIVSRMNTPQLVGACGYVKEDSPRIFLPDRLWQVHFKPEVNVKYIYYYLCCNGVRCYYTSLSTGTSSSMQNLSQNQFYSVITVIPELKEQNEIVKYLDTKCNEIESMIKEKEAMIADLEAYKKSLIFEVVTGKRKVC